MKPTIRPIALLILILIFTGCSTSWKNQVDDETAARVGQALERAGENAREIEHALDMTPKDQKKAMAFLIAYMPQKDLETLGSDFLLENVALAYRARETFPWCQALPEDIFFNEVLPYASLNEERDDWRPDFYNRFEPYVRQCQTIYEAIDSINLNIQAELDVEYNTDRSQRANNSPFQAMKEGMATCTGLSFLLVDAFRAVGIPARFAGTPMWTNMTGNHSWVEVWINGEWYFTEYYPEALNKSWFVSRAGQADPENPIHRIYATSYRPTGTRYPLYQWSRSDTSDTSRMDTTNHGVDVTNRYIAIYQEQLRGHELENDETLVNVVLYEDEDSEGTSDGRVHKKVMVRSGNEEINFGYTPAPTEDLNRYLVFRLKKETSYTLVFENAEGQPKEVEVCTSDENEQYITLYLN
jgi:hypothetical protein